MIHNDKNKNLPNRKVDKKDTSWNRVSGWYDELLEKDSDSYQAKVIAPNLLRILDLRSGENVFDLACGQGYFSNIFAKQKGVKVVASDLSRKLVERASEKNKNIEFHVAPAHKSFFLSDESVDTIVIVLAIQNIENVSAVFAECDRVLKKGGRLVMVINHPAFRVPQASDWHFADDTQSRIVSKYMSESKLSIDMTPGERDPKMKIKTISFHRPMQYYVKLLSKNGLAITHLEEWISHKKSQSGPRAVAEDRARKEIPMFMCIEATKF
jgi:ubiquinone/menaquinone biosynthesis C-methylase UbiE